VCTLPTTASPFAATVSYTQCVGRTTTTSLGPDPAALGFAFRSATLYSFRIQSTRCLILPNSQPGAVREERETDRNRRGRDGTGNAQRFSRNDRGPRPAGKECAKNPGWCRKEGAGGMATCGACELPGGALCFVAGATVLPMH
jgi:hypothetical protein